MISSATTNSTQTPFSRTKPERRAPETWFDQRDPDPDEPVDVVLRTATSDIEVEDSGCVFLDHLGTRGCGLHVAAVEHGFDPVEIKPSVCRLYPLSLDNGRLGLNPDFDRYSCAHSGSASQTSGREVVTSRGRWLT